MTKKLHHRNIHNDGYDFKLLSTTYPTLNKFIDLNQYENSSIDFSNPEAVIALNKALLIEHYDVAGWDILKGQLCPPIPGRTDYLHYIADLLSINQDVIPVGSKVKGLDIGTGSGCIYPILGNSVYGWRFVATDIDSDSLNNCKEILSNNITLRKNIKLRYQKSVHQIFKGIIKSGESFDFTMCNPPFYSSLSESKRASERKLKGLNANKEKKEHSNKITISSNFGGTKHELWYPGGESAFIIKMIEQSFEVKDQCRWFTTIVSNHKNINDLNKKIKAFDCSNIKTIKMEHGNKTVHILAWSF